MTNSIVLPTTADEMRDAIKIAIETYHKSPANDKNKLNESLAKSLGYDNYNKLSPLIKEANKPKILGYYVDRDYNNDIVTIKNTEINNSIFEEDLTQYIITDREDRVHCITQYYAEALAASDSRGDAHLMKEDLNYLESCDDEFVLEAYGTNGFIAASKEPEAFNEACDAILELHEESLTHVCDISFEGNEHALIKATSHEDALERAKEFVLDKIESLYDYDEVLDELSIEYDETEYNEELAINSVKNLNEADLNKLYIKLSGNNSYIKITVK